MLTNTTTLQTSAGVTRPITPTKVQAPSTASRLVESVVSSSVQQEPPVLTKVAQAVSALFAPSASKEGVPVQTKVQTSSGLQAIAQQAKAAPSTISTEKAAILQPATITSGSDMSVANLVKASGTMNASAQASSLVKGVSGTKASSVVPVTLTRKPATLAIPVQAPAQPSIWSRLFPTQPSSTSKQDYRSGYYVDGKWTGGGSGPTSDSPILLPITPALPVPPQPPTGWVVPGKAVPGPTLDTPGSGTELLLEESSDTVPTVEETPPVAPVPVPASSPLMAYIVGGGVGAATGVLAASVMKAPTKKYAMIGLALGLAATYLLKSQQAV